jgi:undecaprenyl-diphosphatase
MDQTLFHLINERWTNPALDLFMAAMSNSAIWRPFILVTILIAIIFGGFKARACIFCMLLTLLIAEQFTGVLKHTFNRPRPKQVERVRMIELQKTTPMFLTLFKEPTVHYSNADRDNSGPSFPSGHVTNNSVIATVLTIFYRRRGALYWIVTGAIGWSRIYLGAHWPSDVIATWFLAVGESLLLLAVLELLWRRASAKWVPTIHSRHPSLLFESE